MAKVDINGVTVALSSSMLIGKGGEADIYRLDPGTVLKLYKKPRDPDYDGLPDAQRGATQRIKAHQTKLAAFPKNLPPEVIAPQHLAYDKPGHIAGYTMPFVSGRDVLMRLSRRDYRETHSLDGNFIVKVFRGLADTIENVHAANVTIGDFSDLNVLVGLDAGIRIIDADSMQFGNFLCQTYTNRFVDPLNCDAHALVLTNPHDHNSDWYAYFVMLIQSLLYVGPYGGVHRPKTGKRLQHDDRVLQRITVLQPDVIYPKPAVPLSTMPDELLQYMEHVFVKDARRPFPRQLLDAMRWTVCSACGFSHARTVCPQCQKPGLPKPAMTIRGNVTAKHMFHTNGTVLQTVSHGGKLRYLYRENGQVYRENGVAITTADQLQHTRLRISAQHTLATRDNLLVKYDEQGAECGIRAVDSYRQLLPVFDTNATTTAWVEGGRLLSEGRLGPYHIANVFAQQTLIWLGETFGFGMYQAGNLTRAFVFRPGRSGINDQVDIGQVAGQLIDATCEFSQDYAWLFLAISYGGDVTHTCYVIDAKGVVMATASVSQGDDSWLGQSIRGHMAAGAALFVATDDGIAKIGVADGVIAVQSTFPDTESFVDTHTYLVPGPGGIYAASNKSITLLTIR